MSHFQADAASRVSPAQVNFLTIYNPELGNTDETEDEQVVFWASRDELLRKQKQTRGRGNGHTQNDKTSGQQHEDEGMGNKLRHIGLARGMVEFANNFSNGKPVSSIETEKSRIVLHELENGWWILASIDLTKLPILPTAPNKTTGKQQGPAYEYSAREVAPAQLLIAQLVRAHRIFLLHHAVSLWEVYHKLGRLPFCALLERYWGSFVWQWDVLLHGNPAIDIHGCATKLAGGGELGVGVGEEEWGSGEREVLEGFIDRTQGLADLVVGRYGYAPIRKNKIERQTGNAEGEDVGIDPWLGHGESAGPADGIVFSGTGVLCRKSLATVSQWMEAIFTHGQAAYGIGENPSARPRAKRRRNPQAAKNGAAAHELETFNDSKTRVEAQKQNQEVNLKPPGRGRAPDLRRKAMQNSAGIPKVPAPLVGTVERALDEATARAASRSSSRSPKSSPTQEKSQEASMSTEYLDDSRNNSDSNGSNSSLFGSDTMMKVLTLGYGSSWTLTPKGWQDQRAKNELDKKQDTHKDNQLSPESDRPPEQAGKPLEANRSNAAELSKPADDRLQELDPKPAVSDDDDDETPFVQRLEKSAGRFLVGLSGDLENTDLDEDEDTTQNSVPSGQTRSGRIFLRTLTIGTDGPLRRASLVSSGRAASRESYRSNRSTGDDMAATIPKTSAGASVDGSTQHTVQHEKVQVAVYIHQPFIFVFLFQLHTPSLTIPGFYHNIHHQLGPLQGPLLKRTDPDRVAERIKDVIMSKDSSTSPSTLAKTVAAGNIVFDLVYDPGKLTIRTSLPNIPIPASHLHEASSSPKSATVSGAWYTLGIPISSTDSTVGHAHTTSDSTYDRSLRDKSAEQWTRLDALNVYGQILNSWIATRVPKSTARSNLNADMTAQSGSEELERTVKTSRGWWVLWMKVIAQPQAPPRPSSVLSSSTATRTARSHVPQKAKEAFLIRRSADYSPTGKTTSRSGSGVRWLLREQSRDGSRNSSASGADGASVGGGSISEGVGIDARKWVEGLLHLSQ